MKVYLVNWNNESGDRGSYLFKKKPTKKRLEQFFKENHPDEWEDGGCYIYWSVSETEVIEIEK